MTELTPMNRIEHYLQNIQEAAQGGGWWFISSRCDALR